MVIKMKKTFKLNWPWMTALLVGFILFLVRIASLKNVAGPVIYGDEFLYWRNMLVLLTSQGSVNSGYPPLYSWVMGLGGLWPDTYRGILQINVLLGLCFPVAAWRFSRNLSGASRVVVVALLSVLPVLLVYPRVMMSENLLIPLLALTMLAMYWIYTGPAIWASVTTGFFLWLACMTRYQGVFFVIGAVLAIVFTGLWQRWHGNPEPENRMPVQKWFSAALLVGGIPCAGILLWKLLGIPSSWEIGQTASYIYRHGIQLTPGLFGMWLAFYLSYCVLGVLPLLPPLIHAVWEIISSKKTVPSSLALLMFGFFSTGISLIVATRHSALVEYNHPDPSHIMGRYLVFFPVLVILGLLATGYFGISFNRKNRKLYLGIWLSCSFLGILSYGTIIGGWFFKLTPWFVMGHTGLDVYYYKIHAGMLAAALLTSLLVMLPKRLFYFTALLVFMGFAAVVGRSGLFNNADGPEAFTEIMENTLEENAVGLVGFESDSWFKEQHALYYLGFKGVDMNRIRIGEGFENRGVTAVVRAEAKADPADTPIFVAKDGQAFYVDKRISSDQQER